MINPGRLLLFSISLILTACSITPEQPAVHDFGRSSPAADSQAVQSPEITVNAPKWLQDTRIRYRLLYSEPTRVRFYALDRWIAPPAELLERQINFGSAKRNASLRVTLLDFEQQFISSGQAKVLIGALVQVYSSESRKLLGAREFRIEQWTRTPDAKGAVNAFSESTQKISTQILGWLEALPR